MSRPGPDHPDQKHVFLTNEIICSGRYAAEQGREGIKLTLIPFPGAGKGMDKEGKGILKENKERKGFPIIPYPYPLYKANSYSRLTRSFNIYPNYINLYLNLRLY